MLAEALKAFVELTLKSAEPNRLDIKDPRKAYFLVGGVPTDLVIPPPPRDHKAGSLVDVVDLANRFGKEAYDKPVVWYDSSAVVLVIDDDNDNGDGHRVEKATLTLEPSDVFTRLVQLREKPREAWMEHGDFVRLLRIELAGTLPPVNLLNTVRKVRFENGSVTVSEKRSQRESLGREITAAVSAEAELPEEVTLSVPVYKTLRETDRWPLRCTVEVDPARGAFRLLPLPDEIERVRLLAVESIEERLTAGLDPAVPHYFGKP